VDWYLWISLSNHVLRWFLTVYNIYLFQCTFHFTFSLKISNISMFSDNLIIQVIKNKLKSSWTSSYSLFNDINKSEQNVSRKRRKYRERTARMFRLRMGVNALTALQVPLFMYSRQAFKCSSVGNRLFYFGKSSRCKYTIKHQVLEARQRITFIEIYPTTTSLFRDARTGR
jgi:hypothetical protein